MITVSRAINTPQQVSERTRERIQEAVAALGYVPNLVAGGLRSARSHVVTALVPALTGPLFGEMVQALTDALEMRGFQVMVGQVGYARSREDALLRAVLVTPEAPVTVTWTSRSGDVDPVDGLVVRDLWSSYRPAEIVVSRE